MNVKLAGVASIWTLPTLAAAQEIQDVPSPYTYPDPAWSPYIVGALIGILVLTTLSTAGKKIGASSAYSDLAGLLGRLIAPQHVRSLPYWRDSKPKLGWTFVVVIGAIAGSFLAAWSGGELTGTYLQDLWIARFGEESGGLRTAVAFAGGTLMAVGARLAGGCTSGHGISGTMQLAVGSWVAVVCFFLGGIGTAMLLYR